MQLTDEERAMLDGRYGEAVQQAMDLLVRYGEALGAERMVEVRNVAGANIFTPAQRALAKAQDHAAAFSELSLNSAKPLTIPTVRVPSCQLIGPMDREQWAVQGLSEADQQAILESESFSASLGIHLLNTCTPYQVGNVPVKGEHCAWMESSAVVYINSVLGARSNVEGRESTAAAMLTGRVPYWGYHLPENRFATHLIQVEVPVESMMDWGLLGYWVGEMVDDQVPVLDGITQVPNLVRLKHFGAAAASSGGVELYHIPGITAEARTVEEALGGRAPKAVLRYGPAERRAAYEHLNATARDRKVDLVMIGCPHANLEQVWEVCQLLEGRHVHPETELWIFTPRALRQVCDRNGYTDILTRAGARLLSDTCPAIGQFLPPGARVVALDSAKQAHYLPAIMGVQGWFGSTKDCVEAAISGTWQGGLE
ncbi:MAG: aconitase X catalytic domain-containing protein [Firmicutes bacterium]|nr:aconitase X catalytic domain-containing protein [Alicyclobacillaceae bacterium]MCL6496908.1 aconitase X catalytic domain-containing protein [Bacillota bacterium]